MNLLFKKINRIFMKKLVFLIFLLFGSGLVFSQKKDTLKTEVVKVVKPYAPVVSEAQKIKQAPVLDSISLQTKKEVKYTFNSVPVVSTFVPAKGNARTIPREPKEIFYNNYISLGFGNYSTPFAEIFAHYSLSDYSEFGGFIGYQSSKGGIDDVLLDDNYSDAKVDLYYKQMEKYYEWQIRGGIKSQVVNWYGLPEQITFTDNVLSSIEEEQQYGTVYLSGDIEFEDAWMKNAELYLGSFVDDSQSTEYNAKIKTNIEFPVWDAFMNSFLAIEYLGGSFEKDFTNFNSIEYSYLNLGFSPNFAFYREDLTVNVGANLWYSITDTDGQDSKFYAYPNITASYKIFEENLIAYGGVTGDLTQNSYREFVDSNPFLSPTLDILRTSQPYMGFIGAKGKILSDLSFNAKIGYGSEKDKPLFKLNPSKTNGNILLNDGYAAGNSFMVVYDDVNTLNAYAEFIYDFDNHLKFGANLDYNLYTPENEDHAWNLPMLKATLLAKYNRKKWYAGADLYFYSDRKDELTILPENTTERITNSAFFDVNLNGGYYLTDRWSVFLKLNNVLNQNYQKYTHFDVQGFQVMGGLTYRFDF